MQRANEIHPPAGMSSAVRFAWGGAGAMAPILASLLILDVDTLVLSLRSAADEGGGYQVVGYAIRVLVLFVLGGIWASLDRAEVDPKRLFQLGVIAPAMITGMLNASNLQHERLRNNPELAEHQVHFSLSPIGSAHAAPAGDRRDDDKPTPLDQIIKGLLGR